MVTVVVYTVGGTYVVSIKGSGMIMMVLGSGALGIVSVISIVFLSINFLKKSSIKRKEDLGLIEVQEPKLKFQNAKTPAIVFFGLLVGFLCGFVGAGGGLMILVLLTAVIGLDTKKGVGTSVLVMTFTALSAGIAHLINIDYPASDPLTTPALLAGAIAISAFMGIIGAKVAAVYANKTKEYMLLRIVAVTFLVLVSSSLIRMVLV